MRVNIFGAITADTGEAVDVSWDDVVQAMSRHSVEKAKNGARLYNFCRYTANPPVRRKEDITAVDAVVLDFDNHESDVTPEIVAERLPDVTCCWHTTFSHSPIHWKWRLIVPLYEPIPAHLYEAAWGELYDKLGHTGIDVTSRDHARCYFVPSCTEAALPDASHGAQNGTLWRYQGAGAVALPVRSLQAAGRNDRLKAIVAAMLSRSETFDDTVREVIAADAKHEVPLFSDPAEPQYHGMTVDSAARQFVLNVAKSVQRRQKAKGQPVEEFGTVSMMDDYSDVEVMDDYDEEVQLSTEFPVSLTQNVGGTIGMMMDHMSETCVHPQPALYLANSIAAIGALCGRKVCTETNLRTNVMTCGIAGSSMGKEHSRSCIKRMFTDAGLFQHYLSCEGVASAQGLFHTMYEHPSSLLQIDEIGHWLQATIKGGATTSYLAKIPMTIMQMESSAHTIFPEEVRSGRDRDSLPQRFIHQPCLCMYGTTTPVKLRQALSPDQIEDGFLARLLFFSAPEDISDAMWPEIRETPHDLINRLTALHEMEGSRRPQAGNLEPPMARIIRNTTEARQAYRDFHAWCIDKRRSMDGQLSVLWGKATASAMRIGLIKTMSDDPMNVVISESNATWSIEVVKASVRQLEAFCSDMPSEKGATDFMERKARIAAIIKKAHKRRKGVTKSDILVASRVRVRDLEEVLQWLEEAGQIESHRVASKTKPKILFSWVQRR